MNTSPLRLVAIFATCAAAALWALPVQSAENDRGSPQTSPVETAADTAGEVKVSLEQPATPPSAQPTGDVLRRLAAIGKIPAELRDPAFDGCVDLSLLGKSWADLDASLMTDVALQFVEGERVLRRSHRAISADGLLEIATRLAAVNQDQTALSRLEQVIKPRGNAALLAQLTAAQQAAAEAPPDDPAQTISVDKITPTAFALYKGYLQDITAAVVAQDGGSLTALEKELLAAAEMPNEHRAKLQTKIDQTRVALSEAEKKPTAVAGILDKLAAATRRGPPPDSLHDGSGYLVPPSTTPPSTTPPSTTPPSTTPPSTTPPSTTPPSLIPPSTTTPPPTPPHPDYPPPPEYPPPEYPPPEKPPYYPPPEKPPYYPPPQPPQPPQYPPQQQQQQQWIPPRPPAQPPQYYPKGKYPPSGYPPGSQQPPDEYEPRPEEEENGYESSRDYYPAYRATGWRTYPRRYYAVPRR